MTIVGQGTFAVANSDHPLPAFAETFDPEGESDKSKSFEAFCQLNPERANSLYTQVSEVTRKGRSRRFHFTDHFAESVVF
jgi:hypothetical protein